jgi:hypothetical protein
MKVWVQLGENGLATRIFSHQKEMFFECPPEAKSMEMDRALAIRQIRVQIWDRQNGACVRCPALLTWESMHMHERKSRGRGGNYGLDNSEGLCFACHLGEFGAHPEKQLRFTKRGEK